MFLAHSAQSIGGGKNAQKPSQPVLAGPIGVIEGAACASRLQLHLHYVSDWHGSALRTPRLSFLD